MNASPQNRLCQNQLFTEWSVFAIPLVQLKSQFRADNELLLVDFSLAAPDQTQTNSFVQVFYPVITKLYPRVDRSDPSIGFFLKLGDLLEFEFEQITAIPKLKPDLVYQVGATVRLYAAGTHVTSPDDSSVISTFVSSPSLPVIWKLVSMNWPIQ